MHDEIPPWKRLCEKTYFRMLRLGKSAGIAPETRSGGGRLQGGMENEG